MENLKELSDGELAALAGQGNNRAFDELMLRYGKHLENYICGKMHNRDAAKDIAQDVWMEALKYIRNNSYSERGLFSGWLRTMALHEVQRIQKRNKIFVHKQVDVADITGEAAAHEELRKQVSMSIGKLKKLPRLVMRMRIERGFPYERIAARLHLKCDYARQLFARAKDEIKKTAAGA